MIKDKLVSKEAPAAIGPYSQGVADGNMVFVSGQLPIDSATGKMAEGIAAQTEQSLKNIAAILATKGLTLNNVVKTTVFMTDLGDFAEMNKVYAAHFSEPFPSRSAVQVVKLPLGAPIEIECIAMI